MTKLIKTIIVKLSVVDFLSLTEIINRLDSNSKDSTIFIFGIKI